MPEAAGTCSAHLAVSREALRKRLLVLVALLAAPSACGSSLSEAERGADAWRTLSPSPLSGRGGHSTVWTGREMLVWGGGLLEAWAGPDDERESHGTSYDPKTGTYTPLVAEHFADGAAYNPDSDSWHELSRSPLAPRSGHAAVWTGEEMLVFGGGDMMRGFADGAAYDPGARRWRRLARPPVRRLPAFTAVWTGRELILWGGISHQPELPPRGVAYDPDRDTWRTIAPFPLPTREGHTAVWTAKEMIVWGGTDLVSPDFADGAAYDPKTDAWRILPAGPLAGRHRHDAIWTGREMIVWGGQVGPFNTNDGAAYDPLKDRWRPLRQAPLAGRQWTSLMWAGREVIVWGGYQFDASTNASSDFADGAAYDPRLNRWRRLTGGPLGARSQHGSVWTGSELLVWGGEGDNRYWADGAAYRPPS